MNKKFSLLFLILLLPFVCSLPNHLGNAIDFDTTFISNVSSFLDLNDTPSSYSGSAMDCVKVKDDETGLEFVNCSSINTSLTEGSVVFIGSDGSIDEDNSNLYWDNNLKRLGVGTNIPNAVFEVCEATAGELMRIERTGVASMRFQATNAGGDKYVFMQVGNAGQLQLRDDNTLTYIGGNVGIDDISPESKLKIIEDTSEIGNAGIIHEQAGLGDSAMHFLLTGTEQFTIGIDNSDSNKLKISDSGNLGTNDRLVIDISGNVGVNTATPQNTFNTVGDGNFTGDLFVGGDLNVTGNLTLGQKITFFLGEIIDNIVDGWIRINGNLNVTGNITANDYYGNFWGNEIGEVNIVSIGVYENVTNLTAGLLNGFTFNESGFEGLTAKVAGVYEIHSGWSFSGSANTEYHLRIALNGEAADNCHAQRKIGTGADVGSASTAPCLVRLEVGDLIQAQIENIDNTNNPTIEDIGLTIKRIGN